MILKLFIEYSHYTDDIYKNIEENDLNTKHKLLITFDDMIADMHSSKVLHLVLRELFLSEVNNETFLLLLSHNPKNTSLNSTY